MENWIQLDWSTGLSAAGTLIGFVSLGFIPLVLLRKKDPAATFAWILVLVFVPVLGIFLFWFLGRERVQRPVRRRVEEGAPLTGRIQQRMSGQFDAKLLARSMEDQPVEQRGMVRLASTLGKMEIVAGNDVRVLVGAEATYDALVEAIDAARDHVHLQFYIFRADDSGGRVLEAMIRAAERGVRVRLLYDGFGSLGLRRRLRRFLRAGGYARPFFPLSLLRRAYTVKLRNHRKLAVIDGEVGFAGGINVGDMFLGWRDVQVRIEGPAVGELQGIFAADWFLATRYDLTAPAFFPVLEPRGDSVVQVLQSGPDERLEAIHRLYFAAIASAQEHLLIATPYFVPDQAMSVALQTAALRGVEVRLIVPRHSNHRVTFHAGRSFYDELLRAGVHVHEYVEGMFHTKAMVVDGRLATVGSFNLDVRSFRLNFEMVLVLYDEGSVRELARLLEEDLAHTELVSLERWRERSLLTRMKEGYARLMSPLL
ncbi:MAG TPA: cardiolipin synthase [Sandaracinaceae bacterium LLY-WYZ-13_1]|nr:cardiolipin synthase [Sandaracinaceae bacterium LLY-WYZ-13_1]